MKGNPGKANSRVPSIRPRRPSYGWLISALARS
jgi:hypothetical protein